jgi:HK97 family phage portal protein
MRTSSGTNLPVRIRGSGLDLAPEGLAELQPIIPQSYYYPELMGLELEYRYALFGEIYERQPWVRACVDKRANAVARLPVDVWDVGNDNTRTLDTRSQYAQLIANPCLQTSQLPYMDPFRFWHWVQTTIDIYGETYLAMVRDKNDVPYAFMPMHPSRVAIRRDPKDGVYTYFFQAGSGINTELVKFDQRDIVPFRLFNPRGLERGFSKMVAIESTIFSEDSSRTAVSSMWRNGGRPNLVLETPNRLSDVGAKRLKLAFENAHAGTSNSGKTLVLEDGVTAKPFQVTAVDLQLIESRKMNREEICAIYDIAPTLVGVLDHATFSNITEQMRGFYRDTMAPVIELIQSVMDTYVGSNWSRKNIMRFATDEVMRGDYEARMEAAHKAVSVAVMTPNEAREYTGLNRYGDEKADKLYCNSAIQELGEPGEIIRMNTAASGTTPDGIKLDPTPTTPIASTEEGKPPTSVPRHPGTPVAVSSGSGGPQPGNQNPSTSRPKHYREVVRQVGRGKSPEEIKAFAMALAAKYPDELDDVLESVRLAIAQRDSKAA